LLPFSVCFHIFVPLPDDRKPFVFLFLVLLSNNGSVKED
jgi:hypothetical protein